MYYRQTKEGKWRYAESYADPLTGRKREVSVTLAKSTRQAINEAREMLAQKIRDRTHAHSPKQMTLSDLITAFVAYQYAMRKESTAKQDEIMLRSVSALIGPDVVISRLTAPVIRDALDRSGRDATWKNQKIKHIKLLLRWAYKQGYLDSTADIDRLERYPDRSARQKVIGKYLESDELKDVLVSMSGNTDYMLLTRFLVLSGCRVGEAFALTVKDVDIASQSLTVNKTYSLTTHKVQSTKTEMSERIVHIRPELLEVIKSALHRQKQIRLVSGTQTALLFPWVDGRHMHYEAYSKYFREHVRKTIGHSLPVHSLRHTYTSLMAEAGVPIEIISRQLGHADSKVTRDIYMHVTDKIRKADNSRLDAVKIL